MSYDTVGNPIYEIIPNCDCGLTGGCEKCNPFLKSQEKYEEGYNLFILGGEVLELGKIFHFETPQPKKKLWGLFKGLKIEEKEIEEAKKSLFPEREF